MLRQWEVRRTEQRIPAELLGDGTAGWLLRIMLQQSAFT